MTETSNRTSAQTLEQIDPRALLVDLNIRSDARLTADFVASVRDQGVLQPVVAVRTADGAHRVRFGHRRTLAAVEAGLATVPVLVAADEGTDDAAQVERLVGQYAENEHRTGLSTGERVAVMAQLAAFGVSPAQIAKRTHARRAEVDAALSVAGSTLATAAAERHDFLDLEQAATVAEFEADPDAVKALVAAASTGQFDHVAQRLRDARAEAADRVSAVEALNAAGVQVIDAPGYEPSPKIQRLGRLTHDGRPLSVEDHGTCPGHAAYVTQEWVYPEVTSTALDDEDQGDDQDEGVADEEDASHGGGAARPRRQWRPTYVCTAYAKHGHVDRFAASISTARPRMADLDQEQQAAARAERRDVIASNKAWVSAETVRRQWLRVLAARRTAPKGSAAFVAGALARDGERVTSIGGNHLAADLLGADSTGYGRSAGVAALVEQAGEPRAAVLTLAMVLAGYEDATTTDSWRRVDAGTARYLRFLAANGYALADVERRACGEGASPIEDAAEATDG